MDKVEFEKLKPGDSVFVLIEDDGEMFGRPYFGTVVRLYSHDMLKVEIGSKGSFLVDTTIFECFLTEIEAWECLGDQVENEKAKLDDKQVYIKGKIKDLYNANTKPNNKEGRQHDDQLH